MNENDELVLDRLEQERQQATIRRSLQRLDQSDLWSMTEEFLNNLSTYDEMLLKMDIESPSLAYNYAHSIAGLWRQSLDTGGLDASQPCYIMELDANSGLFSELVLNALKSILSQREWKILKPLYLCMDARPSRVSDCWAHPALAPWIESGNLEPVLFRVQSQQHIDLASRRLVLGKGSIANPLVVIANGVFSRLPQSLYLAHYRNCFESFIALDTDDIRRSEFHWRECQPRDKFLERYLGRFDSAELMIPDGALICIDNILALSSNGICQVLCTDRGYHEEAEVRECSRPMFSMLPRYVLPLNGHALKCYTERKGGAIRFTPNAQGGALQAVLSFGDLSASHSIEVTSHDIGLAQNDEASRLLLELARVDDIELNPDQLDVVLKQSGYDFRFLSAYLQSLIQLAPGMASRQRRSWQKNVQKVWRRLYMFDEEWEGYFELGLLAMQLNAWGTAKAILICVSERRPEFVEAKQNLVVTLLQLGELDLASRVLSISLALTPNDSDLATLNEYVNSYRLQCHQCEAYDHDSLLDGELSLMPLALHHTNAFLEQYRDPSIAVMTSLPELEDPETFAQWLSAQQALANKATYAITHKDYGFIGVVGVRWHKQTAFFYFWVGVDHQSRGYGQRAATILFEMLAYALNIKQIYTSVFKDNLRSKSALKQLGFNLLVCSAEAPDQDYEFHVKASDIENQSAHFSALQNLLRWIESPIKINQAQLS